MKKKYISLLLGCLFVFFGSSCSYEKDDAKLLPIDITVKINYPEPFENAKDSVRIVFTDKHTHKVTSTLTDKNGLAMVSLERSTYDVKAICKGNTYANTYQGAKNEFVVKSLGDTLFLDLHRAYVSDSWVISEVHYTADVTPRGLPYFTDGYIELRNNSTQLLYADGLCFARVYSLTNENHNIWDKYKNSVVPFFILQVPGEGKQYPVLPGDKLLLAISGINHHLVNPASCYDLSGADFEVYYENSYLNGVDSPVPNIYFKYIAINTSPVILSASEAYFIFRPTKGLSLEDYLSKYNAQTRENNGDIIHSYAIPERDIIDAVQVGVSAREIQQRVLPASLDAGYTYCRIGAYSSVSKRKSYTDAKGRTIWQDTNNSTDDFLHNAPSSYWKCP